MLPVPMPMRSNSESPLIENTSQVVLAEMNGQVDFLQSLGADHFVVGSTVG